MLSFLGLGSFQEVSSSYCLHRFYRLETHKWRTSSGIKWHQSSACWDMLRYIWTERLLISLDKLPAVFDRFCLEVSPDSFSDSSNLDSRGWFLQLQVLHLAALLFSNLANCLVISSSAIVCPRVNWHRCGKPTVSLGKWSRNSGISTSMLAYRRVALRQSIVIWSCGPWRSPWRVASTTWPRPLETCSSGVQWGDAAVSTCILTQVCLWWFGMFFPHVKCWNVITIYHHDHHLWPALRFLIFFGEFLAFLWPHLGDCRIAPSLRHLQGLQPGRVSGSPPLLGRWFLLGFGFYLGLVEFKVTYGWFRVYVMLV